MDPLKKLWELLISTLIDRIETGEYTTQDLNVARQLLKDHGISVDTPEETPIGTLNEILPFTAVTDEDKKTG